MTELIESDGDFLGIWPRESVGALCGHIRPDVPDLPCVLPPHLDGQHTDERGEDWETEDAFTGADVKERGRG